MRVTGKQENPNNVTLTQLWLSEVIRNHLFQYPPMHKLEKCAPEWDMIVQTGSSDLFLRITANLSEHSNTTCKLTLFLLFLTWTATLTDWLVRGVLSQLLVFCFLLGEYIIKSWIYSAWEKLVFSVRFASVPETESSAESSATAH